MAGNQVNIAIRILSNSFLSLVTDLTAKASQALVVIMVARTLGPTDGGAFAIALSYQAILQAFTLTGTNYLLIRDVAKNIHMAADYFFHIIAVKVVLSVFSWIVILLLLNTALHYLPNTNYLIQLLALMVLPEGLAEAERALFLAFERLVFPTVTAVVIGITKVLASYVLLSQGAGIEIVAWTVVMASVSSALINLAFIFTRLVKPHWNLRWGFFRAILPNLSAFASMGILRVFEYQSMILILSYISGEHDVGIYNAAYTLVLAVLLPSQAYANGAMPVFSRLYAEASLDRLSQLYRGSTELILAFALPITVALIWFASELTIGIYTFQYIETIPVLQVLSLTIPFGLFFTPHVCIMLAANLQRWVVRISLASFVVNILTGIVLTMYHAALGAAVARLIATIVVAGLSYLIVYTRVMRASLVQLVGLPALSGAVMVGAAMLFQDSPLGVALLSSGTVYLTVLAISILLSKEHRHLASRMFGIFRTLS